MQQHFLLEKEKKKWNCALIDMDACVGSSKFNMFEFSTKDRSPALGGILITYMLNQPEFKKLFIARAEFLLKNNFSSENLKIHFYKFRKNFSPMVEEHFRRWNSVDGIIKYKKALNVIEKFCVNRPFHFKKNMYKYFNSNKNQ